MQKRFHITGNCVPEKHYMVDINTPYIYVEIDNKRIKLNSIIDIIHS